MFRLFEQNRMGSHDLVLLGTLCNIDAVTRHPDYARFVRLGLVAMVAPPGDEHRAFVDAQATAEDKAVALSFFTLFAHENRHFWDTITTASGLGLMEAALEVQFEFLTRCAPRLASGPIYLPFAEWVQRRKQLAELDPRLVNLPPEVRAFAKTVQQFEQQLRSWEGRDGSDAPTSTQILEGLAVLAQAEAVQRYFGEPARKLFFATMRAGEVGRWYLAAVDYLKQRLPELDPDGQALLLQMSLYGAADQPLEHSCPAALLRYLVDEFEGTRPQFPDSFFERFVLCDGYLSLRQQAGPHMAFAQAGKRFFARLNELGDRLSDHPEAAAVSSALMDYLAGAVNLGARIVQGVLFARRVDGVVSARHVDSLRLTHQAEGVFDVPRESLYFESSHGLILAGPIGDHVLPLVGVQLKPGARSALADLPDNALVELMQGVPDGEAASLLYLFTPHPENPPEHLKQALALFPHLLQCRMAIAGPLETHSLASVLLAHWLQSEGQTVYARGQRIAPFFESKGAGKGAGKG